MPSCNRFHVPRACPAAPTSHKAARSLQSRLSRNRNLLRRSSVSRQQEIRQEYSTTSKDENVLAAAKEARELCDLYNLTVISLQPFLGYEGLLDRHEHELMIKKMKHWFQLAKVLKTDIVAIPSNFMPEEEGKISGDINLIVQDLVEVAELGLQETPPIRFAYESLAWGTYVDTWEPMWDIVQRVNRPNFRYCLDTFNIAGRVWADPASATGMISDNADEDLRASPERMRNTVDIKKVFYVQVVDAERMEQPLTEGHPFHVANQPARMSWSRNARLFVYETERGAYMPSVEVAKAILSHSKFDGWVSLELFSRTLSGPGETVPQTHAQRGIDAWKKLKCELEL